MDYLTEQFNAQRAVPTRRLQLPLNVVQQSTDRHTPPKIKNGILYKTKVRDSLKAYQEDDFSLVKTNKSKPFIKGGFGCTENTMLVESGESSICKININTLEIIEQFDLDIYQSNWCIAGNGFYIVMSRNERSRSFPLQVSRKNTGENNLKWSFKPEDVLKSVSITLDEKIILVTDHRGGISALDIETGEVIWQKDIDTIGVLTDEEIEIKNLRGIGEIDDNPHIYRDVLVMAYLNNYIIGLNIATSAVKWKRKFEDALVSHTIVNDDGRLHYLDAFYKHKPATLYTIDCLTGESIKETIVEHNEELFDSAVYSDVTDTHFWGVTSKGFLYAINLETGQIDWTYNLGNGLPHVPMFICNNRLYVQTLTEQFIFEGQGGYVPDYAKGTGSDLTFDTF